MKKECVLLDVFTDSPFSGNQLAVFSEAEDLSLDQMQRLANEINYSETTFLLESKDDKADFEIRIFTPRSELPFAGHPTLGTAYAIFNIFKNHATSKEQLTLKTKVGIIPLEKENGNIWMRQNEPEFYNQYQEKAAIAGLIGLAPDDISDDYPIEEVSTGNTILIVPIKNLAAIQKAVGNANNLHDFFLDKKSMAPYLFTFETVDSNAKVHTRFFAPHLGIIEDPATGSAAGPLTGYLLKYGIFSNEFEIQNEQGIEINRPSRILMRGKVSGGCYGIEIGGTCHYMGRSTFIL